jgi:hypothetical protein
MEESLSKPDDTVEPINPMNFLHTKLNCLSLQCKSSTSPPSTTISEKPLVVQALVFNEANSGGLTLNTIVLSTVTGEYRLSSNSISSECVSFCHGSSGNELLTAMLIM